ncbi:MAG TPA: hypothetical protein VM223_05720 [Planctomycetota bacterium]|nr:hypothetical protein [Planctomycetota bacterium]
MMTPIEKLLHTLGITQTELAQQLGVSRNHISAAAGRKWRLGPDLVDRLFKLHGKELRKAGISYREVVRNELDPPKQVAAKPEARQ